MIEEKVMSEKSGQFFVIVGAQKSASSFIHNCLIEHPEIWMPTGESPIFEDPDYTPIALKRFLSKFKEKTQPVLGFKRPNYLCLKEVPQRVYSALPDCKIIAVLRNPMDRAYSAYFHYMRDGFLPLIPPEIGMKKIIEDQAFLKKYPKAKEIIDFGLYAKGLKRYLKFFEAARIKVVIHEDIAANPIKELRSIYEFLNVENSFIPKSLKSRPQSVVYDMDRLELLRVANLIKYNYNEARTRLFPRKLNTSEKKVLEYIASEDAKLKSKSIIKTKMNDELRKIYYNQFLEDISLLESMIGRDLSIWKNLDY